MDFELGTAADRILLSAGKLAVNPGGGKINLTVLGSVATGTYDLIDYGAGQASGLSGLSLGTVTGLPAGYTATLLTTSTAVRVVVADPPAMSAFVARAVAGHLRRSRALDAAAAGGRRPRAAGGGVSAGAIPPALAEVRKTDRIVRHREGVTGEVAPGAADFHLVEEFARCSRHPACCFGAARP